MEGCCDLEVDVIGEGVFMVDKGVLCFYSGRLSRLFGKSTNTKGNNLKVIFHDFPGGVEGFELVARFCYNGGNSVEISPSNVALLHCAAQFMEMHKSISGMDNLAEQVEKYLEEIHDYSLSDLLVALKRSEDLPLIVGSSEELIQNFLDALIGRLTLASSESSPCPSTSSMESTLGFRISCDSRSSDSLKTSCTRATWWFEDLCVLNVNLVLILVKSMIARKFDHATIGRFLLYYQKTKSIHAKSEEKCKIMEMVIDSLYSLDQNSVPCKGLFVLLRVALSLNISKQSRAKLEGVIGLRIDEATLDNLLVAAPSGVKSLYDVNLVLRLLRSFRNGGLSEVRIDRLKKVADLVDLFLAEVAPDPYLKPSKLIALAMALPDSARDCFDEMYHAVDMYLEVHSSISEEERLNICCVLNYEKLSAKACLHLSQNKKFPTRSAVQRLISRQGKLKDLTQDPMDTPRSCSASPFDFHVSRGRSKGEEEEEGGSNRNHRMLYYENVDVVTENETLKAQLQGMQRRVNELEQVCRKMQSQVTKMMKSSRSSNGIGSRSLTKLCS